MVNYFQVVVFVALPLLSTAASFPRSVGLQNVENNGIDLKELEKSINPNGETAGCNTNDSRKIAGLSGNPYESSRWRDGYIVQIDPNSAWTQDEINLIEGALYELYINLCIPVLMWGRDANPTGDWVSIQKGGKNSGCNSNSIGRLGGKQIINLEVPGCLTKGIVMHENIHALAFNHEQTRPDRDEYINVYKDQVLDQYWGNYETYQNSLTFDVPYDFQSIMHYGSYDFTKYGYPTMTRKSDDSVFESQRDGLTDWDKAKLQRMYNCG